MRYGLVVYGCMVILALLPASSEAAGKAPDQQRGAAAKPGPRSAPRKASAAVTPPPATQKATEPVEAGGGDGQALRRGERVEFDARLIQGQTAKAGAVYLFERVSSDLSSMVRERRSYRREIVEEVFPQETDR
ncbi:hypothetical protein [Vulgatibacter incomptus]|uniref:Uncharacterized protein n=1 Tax=Vulgatibacter incomptus TaxID=1391653 RepID=A0A0K1PF46_9BACT|nr:hypothetical protein [Vulgatibacter incomptus]AKU92132.1 hypothetical protein AKJ08_2519 [Vulgatibacter incomptus]